MFPPEHFHNFILKDVNTPSASPSIFPLLTPEAFHIAQGLSKSIQQSSEPWEPISKTACNLDTKA